MANTNYDSDLEAVMNGGFKAFAIGTLFAFIIPSFFYWVGSVTTIWVFILLMGMYIGGAFALIIVNDNSK